MVGKVAFLLGLFSVASYAQCTAPTGLLLTVETTVPVNPYIGQAMYWVFDLLNDSSNKVNFSTCSITMSNGSYFFSTPGRIACSSNGAVGIGNTARFQTAALWIPATAPAGTYTVSVTAFNPKGKTIGCWQFQSNVVSSQEEEDDTCTPGVMTATTETWVPVKPVTGQGSYVVVQGQNTGTTKNNAYQCNVTLTQGSYSYGSNGLIACWTGPVKAGAGFRVQTAAVWVPKTAPVGQYTTQIQAYNFAGAPVGCWTGTAIVTNQQE